MEEFKLSEEERKKLLAQSKEDLINSLESYKALHVSLNRLIESQKKCIEIQNTQIENGKKIREVISRENILLKEQVDYLLDEITKMLVALMPTASSSNN